MAQINKYKISWKEFFLLCNELNQKITWKKKKYKNCFAIPKNGIYIANNISIPMIYNEDLISKDTLVIDDLIDSSKTLEKYNGYDKAVLFVKNDNEDKVDYFVEKSDKWIIFPWEGCK